eukprot:5802300-Prymnesium_polylepis.1
MPGRVQGEESGPGLAKGEGKCQAHLLVLMRYIGEGHPHLRRRRRRQRRVGGRVEQLAVVGAAAREARLPEEAGHVDATSLDGLDLRREILKACHGQWARARARV